MDFVWNTLDKITQFFVAHALFAHFQWVDWVTVIFLIAGIMYGFKSGLMRELAEILETLAVIFIVFSFYKSLGDLLKTYLKFIPAANSNAIAFIFLMILVWMLILYLDKQLRKLFHTKLAGPIKAFGGAILGAVHVLLIWSLFSQALLLLPFPKVRKAYEKGNSRTGAYVKNIAIQAYQWMGHPPKKTKDAQE